MLYERTTLAKQPEEVIRRDLELLRNERKMSPDIAFHDPYFLDFLGLEDDFSEKDLESAIVSELQKFITEMGNDFAFMARQKRISVDDEDYYIDLLFFNRRLRCMVAIDLKLSNFKAAYKGQMELYLRWLERNEMLEGENKPIGLILCAGKNEEHIELSICTKAIFVWLTTPPSCPTEKYWNRNCNKLWNVQKCALLSQRWRKVCPCTMTIQL